MVYLYLCNYAHSEPEMAIMCINSLRRDWQVLSSFLNLYYCLIIHTYHSDNEDPLVRGSALRSLCSLRLESILEYVEQPLKKSLTDLSAYVRKTGVMGILKV
jgi:AP-4 complex subunit beta-1